MRVIELALRPLLGLSIAWRVLRWALVIGYLGLIFYGSSLSTASMSTFERKLVRLDKPAHAIEYTGLGGLLSFALSTQPGPALILAATTIAGVYGVMDEIHQLYVPTRTPDPLDVAADTLGGFAGALAGSALRRRFARQRNTAGS